MAKKLSNNEDNESHVHHLVWLDKNIENDISQKNLNQLRELDDHIKTFTNNKQCIDYIRQQNDRNTKSYIIFIVSNTAAKEVLPDIRDCTCIRTVFVFAGSSEKVQLGEFNEVRATCTDINELIARIRQFIYRDESSLGFSLFNKQTAAKGSEKPDEQHPIRNLKEDQARFLWFYKCHNFMIELNDDDQQAKQEMISCCRKTSQDDKRALKILEEFEHQSIEDNAKDPIKWYTKNSAIYRSINEALVSGNISTIYSYRYIIKLLCRQLKKLSEIYQQKHKNETLQIYRGQTLKLSQILLISKHIGDLISLNSFVSTSLDKAMATTFCSKHEKKEEDHEPVLFHITIDMKNKQSIDFADIQEVSNFPYEEEILLSIGSVFRIESVKYDDKKELYRIELSLSQHEQLLVNHYIEQTYPKEMDAIAQSVLFGKLLFDMGEYKFAIKYFHDQIDRLSDADNDYRATYLNNMGVCYNQIDEKDKAFRYYRTASQMYKEKNDRRGLRACCHNIAGYYYDKKDYDAALNWALEALHQRQESQLEKASTLDLLGCIQLAKGNPEAARDNLREALTIRVKCLGDINPNHPDIGISYKNLGRLDLRISSYIDAQNNFLRAEQIFRHNYPESHPLIREITQYLEDVKQKLQH